MNRRAKTLGPRSFSLTALVLSSSSVVILGATIHVPAQAVMPPQPVVAIHVSELTHYPHSLLT